VCVSCYTYARPAPRAPPAGGVSQRAAGSVWGSDGVPLQILIVLACSFSFNFYNLSFFIPTLAWLNPH
jgi:hypothetical protein